MLLSTQNTHAERLIHLGLNQEAVEAEDVTLQFAFPRKLSGLRDYTQEKACRLAVGLKLVLQAGRAEDDKSPITPDAVCDWLIDNSIKIDRELWLESVGCVYDLCMHLLPGNLHFADLRHFADILSAPHQYLADATRYARQRSGLTVLGIIDEDEMDALKIDTRYVEDHSFFVGRALSSGGSR